MKKMFDTIFLYLFMGLVAGYLGAVYLVPSQKSVKEKPSAAHKQSITDPLIPLAYSQATSQEIFRRLGKPEFYSHNTYYYKPTNYHGYKSVRWLQFYPNGKLYQGGYLIFTPKNERLNNKRIVAFYLHDNPALSPAGKNMLPNYEVPPIPFYKGTIRGWIVDEAFIKSLVVDFYYVAYQKPSNPYKTEWATFIVMHNEK